MRKNHQAETLGIAGLVLVAVLGVFLAMMLPDLKRYLRIHRM